MQFAVIGVPENRRVALFQEALARLGFAPAPVLSYRALVGAPDAARAALARFLDPLAPGSVVRIESPGGDFEVARGLLVRGAGAGAPMTAAAARALAYERGRIVHPAQQFAGYRRVLDDVAAALAERPALRVTSTAAAIATLFDKAACRALLESRGVRVPAGLGPVGSFSDLRARLYERRADRAFVKLRHGSSASGVVAYRAGAGGESAITSTVIERRGGRMRMYNSLALREYRRPRDISALIDELAREGVVAEAWVDKAHLGGDVFDLRIVCIAGQARHAVVRRSRAPMTNLHLGNQRGTIEELIHAHGPAAWERARDLAEAAAACVPQALHIGVDVLIDEASGLPYIVEMNAFGDLLPGILDRGDDTYAAEIRALVS